MQISVMKEAIELAKQVGSTYATFSHSHADTRDTYEADDLHGDAAAYKETLASQSDLINFVNNLTEEDALDMLTLLYLGRDHSFPAEQNGEARFAMQKQLLIETLDGVQNENMVYSLLLEKTKKLDKYLQEGLEIYTKE